MLLSSRLRRLASPADRQTRTKVLLRRSTSNLTFTRPCVTHKSDLIMGEVEIPWSSVSVL